METDGSDKYVTISVSPSSQDNKMFQSFATSTHKLSFKKKPEAIQPDKCHQDLAELMC